MDETSLARQPKPDPDRRQAFIGAEIRRLRERRGWSVDELSGRASVPATLVERLEAGTAVPRLIPIVRLACALDLDVDEFAGWDDGLDRERLQLVKRLMDGGVVDDQIEEILALGDPAQQALIQALLGMGQAGEPSSSQRVDESPAHRESSDVRHSARQHIGSEVRRLRLARGWSGEDLAQRVGISVSHVSQIERGASLPSFTVMARLASTLGVSLTDFADLEAEMAGVNRHIRAVLVARGLNDAVIEQLLVLDVSTRRVLEDVLAPENIDITKDNPR